MTAGAAAHLYVPFLVSFAAGTRFEFSTTVAGSPGAG